MTRETFENFVVGLIIGLGAGLFVAAVILT